jgi:hypothetical protein
MARVLRAVISNNSVKEKDFDSKEDEEALTLCFQRGWLQATLDEYYTSYVFATPLHQWFVEYYLGTELAGSTPIADQDLPNFAINVIRRLSPKNLSPQEIHYYHKPISSQEQIGASDKLRPREARFQDEFYRCCHEYANGSLISFPEFGYASGKVHLYIPCREWGVELLRDGDSLEDYSSRFIGQGAYPKMKFSDYITLDFSTEQPQKKDSG